MERNDFMNIKKIVSSVVSATLLATSFTLPSYAEESFSTVQEFLTDVISLSTSEVESQSLDAAIEAAINKVTTVGDEVFYDGTSIGYWYSDSSSTLWTSESKEATAITTDTNGYTVNPSILYDILYDVNDKLEDNYVPTTTDWSKIIGKYDITLGGITIPASQWVEIEAVSNPIDENKTINLSALTGVCGSNLSTYMGANTVYAMAWLVSSSGELYLQEQILGAWKDGNPANFWAGREDTLTASMYRNTANPNTYTYPSGNQYAVRYDALDLLKAGLTNHGTGLYVNFYITDTINSTIYRIQSADTNYSLRSIKDTVTVYKEDISSAKKYGVVYFTGSQLTSEAISSFHNVHLKMFEEYSSSKLIKGNQKLTRRLSALATLLPTDTVTVTATNWTINGHDNSIDNYITDQELNNAGDTADISAVADIDALKFHVIVPTSLPIYVDDSNITYVANNADIINKSGAAVELTEVNIVANAESGWTMVDGSPTKEMEGHEFNFSTTIEQNKVLDVSEVYPFQYMANLSPTTEASSSLELATVMVTVDWATA